MILDLPEVERWLSLARELGRSRPLYDVHVSPYEVIFDRFTYREDPRHPGVLSLSDADDEYVPPRAGPLRIEEASVPPGRPAVPGALSLMMYRRCFAHVGPRVLGDHMALSGISRCLLVPVVRADGGGAESFDRRFAPYRGDPRFALAYCAPRGVEADRLIADVRRIGAEAPVRALKVNPNLQGVDLASEPGRRHVEQLLLACRATGLPLVLHGGVSTVLEDPRNRAFASLDNLLTVEWRQAGAPVVLAHAGMFGCPADEVSRLLPRLHRLLAENENLLVDVSGLGFDALSAVLHAVDVGRIVFGSDALYFPQWGAVVKVLFALKRLGRAVEEEFVRLAGSTPGRHLFGEAAPVGRDGAGTGER